jgi:hypothetical protein
MWDFERAYQRLVSQYFNGVESIYDEVKETLRGGSECHRQRLIESPMPFLEKRLSFCVKTL